MIRFKPAPIEDTEIQRVLRACTGTFLIIAVFGLAINMLTFVAPLYMMQLFDRVLSSQSIDTLIMLTLIACVALAVLSLIDGIRSQILVRIGGWLDDRLGPTVLAGALQAALRNDTGHAGQGLRDLATIRSFLTGPAITPLMDAPWAPIYLLSLFVLHPVLGFVGFGGGAALFTLAILNEVLTKKPLRQAGAAASRTQYRVEAALRNAEVIRSMGMLDGVIRLWQRDSEEAVAAQSLASDRGALILAMSKFLRLTVQTTIMGVGAWLVIAHDVSPGAMFASSFLLGRALAPVENAIGTWRSLVAARVAYRRLGELFALTPRSSAPAMVLPTPDGRLSVEGLGYIPPGAAAPTLRGVSFALTPGQMLGVIGPSAAGKSTLARLIAGSWLPSAGNVRLDGANISVWLDSGGSRHLGYLPQDIELFSGSFRENIGRLGDAEPSAVIEAAKLAGMHEQIMRMPAGYDSEIGEAGVRLSGGQRQRIGLARALIGNPRLVVLDEPNASLDAEGEEALLQTIEHLKSLGTTIVIIAHRSNVLALADKLLVLRNGAVDLFGDCREVIAKLNSAATTRPQRSIVAERHVA